MPMTPSAETGFTPLPARRCLAVMVGWPWSVAKFELCVSDDIRPEHIPQALLKAYPEPGRVAPEIKVTYLDRDRCSWDNCRHFLIERVT